MIRARALLPLVSVPFVAAGCPHSPPPTVHTGEPPPRCAWTSSAPASAPVRPRAAPVDHRFLEQYAATYRFRLGRPRSIAVTPDGSAVLYLRSGPRSFVHDLYIYDIRRRAERRLLSAAQLLSGSAERLSDEEKARRERQRLMTRGIAWFRMSRDGARLLVSLSGRLYLVERASGQITRLGRRRAIDPRLSPDGRSVAFVRDGDLYVLEVAGQRERRLTRRRSDTAENGLAEFVAQEEMGRHRGFWWSPDSAELVYQQNDSAGVDRLHILDPAHPERAPSSRPYPRPGRPNVKVALGLVRARGGPTRSITWDRRRYPYLVSVKWPRKAPLTLVVENRRQTEMAVLAVDRRTGRSRLLLTEGDAAWVSIDQQVPRWLPDGSGFLWTTERDGVAQLELRARDGKLVRSLTRPALNYRGLLDVDPGRGEVLVRASAGSPREIHLFRLPLGGGARARKLTTRPGLHDAVVAEDHSVRVQTLEPLAGPHRYAVFRRDGGPVGQIRCVTEKPRLAVNLELVAVGERRLQAAVVRPRGFDKKLRYPVLVYVYGGPNYQVVTARRHRYLLQQWLADQGFIVVSVDGRGTPGRGRAWERAIKGNFVKVPLADQVAGLRALGRRFHELDLERVGVFGWSFGGYLAAMAVLARPDVFHAAVAGAPVTEWLNYDSHYTERYLGLPADNRAGYRASSAIPLASGLRRPLLLIHGTVDDNVYFSHTMLLSDALFRAGRHHELLALSRLTHLVPDPLITRRLYDRIVAFFRRSLKVDRRLSSDRPTL
jgi:dipeptidyl-peptidase-4